VRLYCSLLYNRVKKAYVSTIAVTNIFQSFAYKTAAIVN